MTKTTPSKAHTTLSIITKKLEAKKKLHKPDSFYDKGPKHSSSPSSSSSEEEEATQKQQQKTTADEVSRVLNMDGEEGAEERTEGETKSSNDAKANVSEEPSPITLDEVLQQAGVYKQERKAIKEDISFWWPRDLVDLSPADIITEPQYCSRTAIQALYTIASQVSKHRDGSNH